ncbi:DNA binding protein, putative [Ricinus communis]|uniref:DNA binding protein, putative n=2 Tax=Ricinus communis TaxID=3988 RepID=B9SSC2_RICCO|nr:DNA binding protein, putative [Ricinus communis]|eukprot:XP_002528891.3 transcription factor bHLH93 [Ricinus communis]
MELSQHGFLEELLQGPRIRDTNSGSGSSWATFPITTAATGSSEFFTNGWNFDSFDENTSLSPAPNPCSFLGFPTPTEPTFDCSFNDQTYPFFDGFTAATTTVPTEIDDHTPPFPTQEDYPSMVEDEELGGLLLRSHSFEERLSSTSCKVELEQASNNNNNGQVFSMGLSAEKKNKSKKLEGQPSKNLMAERRRRKRLNDRLSMLRSIVPKISKMDRTSILGDTIDYMKELLERINKLQEEESEDGTTEMTLMTNLNEIKPNEVLVRNSPKFNVDRREIDTRIDICCSAKPGLLLSTVNTLEALGLEIQQCVISCFNDFSMQASCSEADEQRTLISPEDIKQALFRTAGYGGRCL